MDALRTVVAAGMICLSSCAIAQDAAPTAEVATGENHAQITDSGSLLDALEGVDIERLTATIRYTRIFSLAGDMQVRTGKLAFEDRGEDGSGKRFAVRFDQLIVGQRIEDETKRFVFDGQWLVEELPAEKLFVKRQVAPPGAEFDPLKIGEGPMPIPIGQKKADILGRFDAELLAPSEGLEEGALVAFAADAWQLRLVPKDPEDADMEEVRVWYAKGSLLPVMARTIDLDGDESIVQLLNQETGGDASVEADLFDVTAPAPGAGWDVRIEPWRG